MDSLLHELTGLATQPLGTVVYLGADAAALEGLLALPADHVVLVQGDPDEASELRHLTETAGKRAQVISQPVAAQARTLAWHRYNLASLNGPLEQSGLQRFYPRLRQTGLLSLPARPIAELLDEVCPEGNAQPALLVVDLPGQEQALLAALAPAQLQRFKALVVRGCSERHSDGTPTLADTLAGLQESCWRPDPSDAAPDPLWPVAVLRFDARLHQQQENERRLAVLQARLVEMEARAARHEQINSHQQTLLNENVERLAAAERANVQQAEALARAATTVAEHQQSLALAHEALAAAQQRDRALQASQTESEAQRADLNTALQSTREALVASEARVAELNAQMSRKDELHQQQRKLLEEQTQLAAERAAQATATGVATAAVQLKERQRRIQQLETESIDTKQQLEQIHRELARAEGLLEQQRKSLEERTRLAADRGTRIVELETSLAAEQVRSQNAQQALAALQAAHQAAMTQAAAEQHAQAQADAEQLAQAQKAAREASEQARLQLEAARTDLQKAAATHEAQVKAAAEATAQLKERQKRIQQLEAEVADATQRLELMHQELAKAEGQFDLLRELLLQEPTL
jgi:hypothetical protein